MPIELPPGVTRQLQIGALVGLALDVGATVSADELRARLEKKTDEELSALVRDMAERLTPPCGVAHCQCSCHDEE